MVKKKIKIWPVYSNIEDKNWPPSLPPHPGVTLYGYMLCALDQGPAEGPEGANPDNTMLAKPVVGFNLGSAWMRGP